MNVKFKCMAIVIAAVGTVLSAQNVGGVKAQIVSERKGNTKVFEEARAATVAKTWKSPNGGKLPYRLHVLAISDTTCGRPRSPTTRCSNGSSPNAVKRLYRRIFCQVFVRCETLLRSSVQPLLWA